MNKRKDADRWDEIKESMPMAITVKMTDHPGVPKMTTMPMMEGNRDKRYEVRDAQIAKMIF